MTNVPDLRCSAALASAAACASRLVCALPRRGCGCSGGCSSSRCLSRSSATLASRHRRFPSSSSWTLVSTEPWVPMVATVPMAQLAAAFRARCHRLRSHCEVVGIAGGAPGCPGALSGALISGYTGTRPGTRIPAGGLLQNTEPLSPAGLPKPAWLASNLLDNRPNRPKNFPAECGWFFVFFFNIFIFRFFSFLVV